MRNVVCMTDWVLVGPLNDDDDDDDDDDGCDGDDGDDGDDDVIIALALTVFNAFRVLQVYM